MSDGGEENDDAEDAEDAYGGLNVCRVPLCSKSQSLRSGDGYVEDLDF